MNWLSHLLISTYWPETGHGYAFFSGPGSDITEIAIVGGLIDVARRMVKHHRQRSAQAERHHLERQATAEAHHNALLHQAQRHHQQALDQAGAHHEALKAHIAAAVRAPKTRISTKEAGP